MQENKLTSELWSGRVPGERSEMPWHLRFQWPRQERQRAWLCPRQVVRPRLCLLIDEPGSQKFTSKGPSNLSYEAYFPVPHNCKVHQ